MFKLILSKQLENAINVFSSVLNLILSSVQRRHNPKNYGEICVIHTGKDYTWCFT